MKRLNGMLQLLAHSKSCIDESILNGILFDMYLNMLQFCRQSLRADEDIHEEEGGLNVFEFNEETESETESVTDGSSTDQENVQDESIVFCRKAHGHLTSNIAESLNSWILEA